MIGIVLETLQREHEQFAQETGEGEAGEVHSIELRTSDMVERMQRMEQKMDQLLASSAHSSKDSSV